MIVEVTQEDIERGRYRNSLACPVARALSRTLGQPVAAGAFGWRLWPVGEQPRILFSRRTEAWISRFDAEKPVKPFKFRTRRPK